MWIRKVRLYTWLSYALFSQINLPGVAISRSCNYDNYLTAYIFKSTTHPILPLQWRTCTNRRAMGSPMQTYWTKLPVLQLMAMHCEWAFREVCLSAPMALASNWFNETDRGMPGGAVAIKYLDKVKILSHLSVQFLINSYLAIDGLLCRLWTLSKLELYGEWWICYVGSFIHVFTC